MGRPKGSSYKSYQLIYRRLLQVPLCLEDWRSAGLRSRSTVYHRLRHLVSVGLVKRRREGHKILYEMAPLKNEDGTVTYESLVWAKYLVKMTRKEKRKIKRRVDGTLDKLWKAIEQTSMGLTMQAVIQRYIDRIISLPESQKLLSFITGWHKIPLPYLLKYVLLPNLNGQICFDCLSKRGIIVYCVTDHNTGEVICPNTGEVVREESIEFEKRKRPSPFPPSY